MPASARTQAEQDAQGRRLARAVRAEEAVHLAAFDPQVEPVEGDGGAEAPMTSVRPSALPSR